MPISMLESSIFKDMFGTAAMREVFDDAATVYRYTETEIALAKVQGLLGVIPAQAADVIAQKADSTKLDMVELKRETEIVGYPILPLVHQLSKMCGPEGEYLHWGATTQDIMDTATVLQVRAGLKIIETDLDELDQILDALAAQYRDAPMAGRTHLQHALPITFGYKVAVWLLMIRRHRERLLQLKPRVLIGQFGGAAGTLASLGSQGLAVHAALMARADRTGPDRPGLPWLSCRARSRTRCPFPDLGRCRVRELPRTLWRLDRQPLHRWSQPRRQCGPGNDPARGPGRPGQCLPRLPLG